MRKKELTEILEKHRLWLNNDSGERAKLIDADLIDADLSRANLSRAYLSRANLIGADLRGADLRGTYLIGAYLIGAKLIDADLSGAYLIGADLRGAEGLLDAAEWMKENFVSTSEGVIVYKAFDDTFYYAPERWEISEGAYITEVCNPNRTDECGCGVNFGTLDWTQKNVESPLSVWKCLIEWIDLVSVVVPYNTDGKARCERLRLIERLE